jgi:hypothetical protein
MFSHKSSLKKLFYFLYKRVKSPFKSIAFSLESKFRDQKNPIIAILLTKIRKLRILMKLTESFDTDEAGPAGSHL